MHLVSSMAYVNQEPWHGLGNKLAPKQPLSVWAKAAGMDWRIDEAEVRYVAGNDTSQLGAIHAFPEQKVLYRSDTKAALSIVSARYQGCPAHRDTGVLSRPHRVLWLRTRNRERHAQAARLGRNLEARGIDARNFTMAYTPDRVIPAERFTFQEVNMSLPGTPGPGRERPALRLVETKGLPRADWLEARKSGIGGSDSAAAIGLNPYMSPLELWLIKTRRDANLPRPDSDDTTEPVYWGNLLEPIVAASYTKQTVTVYDA